MCCSVAAVMLPRLKSTTQQRHGASTAAGLTNSKNCAVHTSPTHALESGKSQADFMPSLGYAGVSLTARDSNSGASVTSTVSKRGGMLSKLKTTSLASSISAMLSSSPRDRKKGAPSKKQQQQQQQIAGDTDGSGKPPKVPIDSSSPQHTSARSEVASEAPYRFSYRTSDPFGPSYTTEKRAQRERAYTTCSLSDGAHGLVRTNSSMSATAAMISTYQPSSNQQQQQQQQQQKQQQLEQSLKLSSSYIVKHPLHTSDEYYEDCGSASDSEAVASHFVTLEDCTSESHV
jgi:hypothetical protein